MTRQISADHPLHFGEFTNGLGDKISLGQMTGTAACLSISISDERCQISQSFSFLLHRAKTFEKSDLAEAVNHTVEGRLAILIPEKAGIGEACPQDTFITGTDDSITRIIGTHIRYRGEIRRQRAVRFFKAEIFLVAAHRRDQNFTRQLHEIIIDLPMMTCGYSTRPVTSSSKP